MISTDFSHLLGAILVVEGAILPVVNPPSDAPIFLRLTAGCDAATRNTLARATAIYSFALLLGSMLFGSFILRLFELSVAVIQVSGGAARVRTRLEAAQRRSETSRRDGRSPPGVGDRPSC